MEKPHTETGNGEILIRFEELASGKFSLSDVGFDDGDLTVAGGNLRLKLEFDSTGRAKFFRNPTFVISYDRRVKDVAWECEMNGDLLYSKVDHSGDVTVFTIDEHKLEHAVRKGRNRLIIRADFPEEVALKARESHFHLLETPGS